MIGLLRIWGVRECMKIKSLHLENYRCFENFDIDFDEHLTVLVGVNGAGKTAVLDALSIFLRVVMEKLQRGIEDVNVVPVTDSIADLTINSSSEEIKYDVNFDLGIEHDPVKWIFRKKTTFPIEMALTDPAWPQHVGFIKSLHKRFAENQNTSGWPIFAYYGAKRVLPKDVGDIYITKQDPSFAFKNSFSPAIDFKASLEWFFRQEVNELYKGRDEGNNNYRAPHLQAVRAAIIEALGVSGHKYAKVRMFGNPPKLMIQKDGVDYNVNQLSDGYRTMLALVMDLARRMAEANGHIFEGAEIIKKTQAVVLIDEVELHLHPSWQQTVLPSLMEIFPNTQFIVTTHSPQVLTSIPNKHIRVLEGGRLIDDNPPQSEGAESSRVLKRILNVETRPQSLPIVAELRKYSDLVSADKWGEEEAATLYTKLKMHFGDNDPELSRLEMIVENRRWEKANGL